MMRCPSCGHENSTGMSYCTRCGVGIEISCTGCGRKNPPDSVFCGKCGQRLSLPGAPQSPSSGTSLRGTYAGGRYEIRRLLGEGGKKQVYLAHDTRLERDVALAVLKTDGLDEAGLARVRREARAMGRLGDHPHVVTVHDLGEEEGRPYIVSQYMAGGSMADLLGRSKTGRLPIAQALSLSEQICAALDHAHSRGVIHRDLKPDNVWLSPDGTAKLGDFGLALALDRSRLTLEGMMVGTVAYMAPEQALGRAQDARADLYALGAMLYELVTGRPPFLGDDAVAIISQHINTPPVAPSWHNPEVSRALEALILNLLAKVPEERPTSARAVREALAAIADAAAAPATAGAPTEVNPLDRLAGGVFVGREREMDVLRGALEDALAGRGRLVLLVGEPGIGKTRTAEELVTYARLRKAQVLWGRCYEGDGAPAYWPWVQAIRTYVHEREPEDLQAEMGSAAADIAQVVSAVRDRLPQLPAPPALEPDQARFRLFDGVTSFLKNAGSAQPLVLILDDIHWADKPSLLLLQFLARELRGARLLVLGAYRDVEVQRQHPLSQTLGELAREQLAERVLLRGLSANDVARFIEITAGFKPPAGLVDAVYRETEGNPFFVNEIVRLLVTDGRLEQPERVTSWSVDIPQGVRDVIGRRLDRLSAECNRVLSTAAVVGREFGLDVLAGVTGTDGDRLLEVLEEALAARVIVEVPRALGSYRFAHALIRETLYEELTTTRRMRLHRQIGEALEALYGAHPEPHLAELAYHFCEAAQGGDVARAVAYAVRAGERAADLMAHEEAAHQYERGLQALEVRQTGTEAQRCELLLRLNEALWRAGEYKRAKEVALEAADLARRLGAAEPLARAALAYGGPLLGFAAVNRDETLVNLLEEALVALGTEDSALRATMLARLAEEITFSDPYERRETLCREAIAMARRLGDSGVLAYMLRSAHWALWAPPENLQGRLALAHEVLELAERDGHPAMLFEGHALYLGDLLEMGDIAGGQATLQSCCRLADQLRQPYHRWITAISRFVLALAQGKLAELEQLAEDGLQTGQEAQNENAAVVYGLQIAALLRESGRNEELEPLMMSFADAYPFIRPSIRCALAVLYCEEGRLAEAREEFERLAANGFADLPRNTAWLFDLAYLSEICASVGDAGRAQTLYAMLSPFADRNVYSPPVLSFGSVGRYLGLLAATMGREQEAARHFEDALAMNLRMGARNALARTQIEYAGLLLASDRPGDRSRAIELANQALEIATELGMRLVVERALALKLGAQGIPPGDAQESLDAVASLVQEERPDLRAQAAPDGTVTILFTDIEGFTPMTERLGDQGAQEVIRAHNRIVRRQVADHGGFEVKAQGDGFMLAFQSARWALRCAVALQRVFATTDEFSEPVRLRIGLHTGEAIREADDFFGKAVIHAARIASVAAGGEILVSALLRELTDGTGGFTFGAVREVELKGLKGHHQVFSVAW